MLLPNISMETCEFRVLKELSERTTGAKSLLCSSVVLSRNSDKETPKVDAINKNDKNKIIAFAQENLLFPFPNLLSNLQTSVQIYIIILCHEKLAVNHILNFFRQYYYIYIIFHTDFTNRFEFMGKATLKFHPFAKITIDFVGKNFV